LQTTADLHALITSRTMLVLAASPGDESLACGTLIAEACARGRPPLVAVLTDGASIGPAGLSGDVLAAAHERETRVAVQALGLPPGRLLMLGVRDGALPADGAFFEQIVDAVGFLTWMRDLDVICGPRPDDPPRAHVGAMAVEIARQSGIGLLTYGRGPRAVGLAIPAHEAAKRRAVAAHVSLGGSADGAEWFT
jgi:LmbE family N-acetylglucosaminyl deacetylase